MLAVSPLLVSMFNVTKSEARVDNLFSQGSVPQPNNLNSDSIDFAALTTFDREAVLSKFVPGLEEFGAKHNSDSTAKAIHSAEAGLGNSSQNDGDLKKKKKLSSDELFTSRTNTMKKATQSQTSKDRLKKYRRQARDEEQRNRTARAEQTKLNAFWDAASRIVRHKRYPYTLHSAKYNTIEYDKSKRSKIVSACRFVIIFTVLSFFSYIRPFVIFLFVNVLGRKENAVLHLH